MTGYNAKITNAGNKVTVTAEDQDGWAQYRTSFFVDEGEWVCASRDGSIDVGIDVGHKLDDQGWDIKHGHGYRGTMDVLPSPILNWEQCMVEVSKPDDMGCEAIISAACGWVKVSFFDKSGGEVRAVSFESLDGGWVTVSEQGVVTQYSSDPASVDSDIGCGHWLGADGDRGLPVGNQPPLKITNWKSCKYKVEIGDK